MEWLSENMWALWLGLGLVLATCEMLTLDLTLLMLSGGAFAALATSLVLPDAWIVQLLVGLVVSVGLLFFLRPTLLQKVRDMPGYRSSIDTIIGSRGIAAAAIDGQNGQVKVGGDTWAARTAAPGLHVRTGDEVVVTAVDGVTLVVTPRYESLQ